MLRLAAPPTWNVRAQAVRLAGALRDARRLVPSPHGRGGRVSSWSDRAFRTSGEASALEQQLRPLAARLRRQRLIQTLPTALLVACAVASTSAVLARFSGLPGLLWLGIAAGTVAALALVIRVGRRRVGPFETARHADASLTLKERLATALELLDGGLDGPVASRQVQDAEMAIRSANASSVFSSFAPGTESRRRGLRRTGYALGAVAIAAVAAMWPGASGSLVDQDRGLLALADPSQREERIVKERQLRPKEDDRELGGIEGRTNRPDQIGDLTEGLVGKNELNPPSGGQGDGGQSSQPGQQNQQAQQDARSQQNSSVAERQQALQDLGSALRQSQTARQAGDSLKRGDTQRAAQQLNELGSQINRLSPGERQALTQSFRQASEQIGQKDRSLADAAKRAADALSQFRNQDAQQAIRDAANQVRDTGQQAQAQKQLQERAQDLEKGGQPNLPQGQQGRTSQPNAAGSQQSNQGGQSGQQGQQPGLGSQPRQGGDGGAGLSELEQALQSGGLPNGSGGAGAGGDQGSTTFGAPHRLSVDARPVVVEAEEREGPTQWRPPSPTSPPGAAAPAAAALPAGPVSVAPISSGPDLNVVPWDVAGSVLRYFTPEQGAPKP